MHSPGHGCSILTAPPSTLKNTLTPFSMTLSTFCSTKKLSKHNMEPYEKSLCYHRASRLARQRVALQGPHQVCSSQPALEKVHTLFLRSTLRYSSRWTIDIIHINTRTFLLSSFFELTYLPVAENHETSLERGCAPRPPRSHCYRGHDYQCSKKEIDLIQQKCPLSKA